jgi:ribosomal protein S18 acetylase RimI-like enzyme
LTALTDIKRIYDDQLPQIMALNEAIFGDRGVIKHWEATDIRMYVAQIDGENVGFKIGYQLNPTTYYSAKGGVLAAYRRKGVAKALLEFMIQDVKASGYERFLFDTFPNKDPGMSILALNNGFRVIAADFNPQYKDYRLRFERKL